MFLSFFFPLPSNVCSLLRAHKQTHKSSYSPTVTNPPHQQTHTIAPPHSPSSVSRAGLRGRTLWARRGRGHHAWHKARHMKTDCNLLHLLTTVCACVRVCVCACVCTLPKRCKQWAHVLCWWMSSMFLPATAVWLGYQPAALTGNLSSSLSLPTHSLSPPLSLASQSLSFSLLSTSLSLTLCSLSFYHKHTHNSTTTTCRLQFSSTHTHTNTHTHTH